MICNMSCRMGRNVDDGCPHVAQLHHISATHVHIQRRYPLGFCRRPRDDASRRGLNLRIAANMIRVPMRVPNLRYLPPACFGRSQNGRGNGRIDHQGFPALRVMDQPDIIVREHRNPDNLEHVTRPRYWACWPKARQARDCRLAAARSKYRRAYGQTPYDRRVAAG